MTIMKPQGEVPDLLKVSTMKKVLQSLEETTSDSDVQPVKMRISEEFITQFNSFVFSLLVDCADNARNSGRKTLSADDVPQLEETGG